MFNNSISIAVVCNSATKTSNELPNNFFCKITFFELLLCKKASDQFNFVFCGIAFSFNFFDGWRQMALKILRLSAIDQCLGGVLLL
jgi:hypothetical protein